MKIALLASMLLSTLALASPKRVALPVGHSMTMAMPGLVKSVRVSDPKLVEVRQEKLEPILAGHMHGSGIAV